jgi:hypothetical protein
VDIFFTAKILDIWGEEDFLPQNRHFSCRYTFERLFTLRGCGRADRREATKIIDVSRGRRPWRRRRPIPPCRQGKERAKPRETGLYHCRGGIGKGNSRRVAATDVASLKKGTVPEGGAGAVALFPGRHHRHRRPG